MKKAVVFVLLAGFAVSAAAATRDDHFVRGIVYLLLGDKELTNQYLETYYRANPQPEIKM